MDGINVLHAQLVGRLNLQAIIIDQTRNNLILGELELVGQLKFSFLALWKWFLGYPPASSIPWPCPARSGQVPSSTQLDDVSNDQCCERFQNEKKTTTQS
jgi:hypothetical protein